MKLVRIRGIVCSQHGDRLSSSPDLTKSCVLPAQALSKWGNWGMIAPGVANGQSEIKFTKLEFARPADIAAQFEPDEGFTGLVQAVIFEVNDRGLIGYPTKTGHRYCCAKDMVSKTKCSRDRLIYSVRSPVSPSQLRRCWTHSGYGEVTCSCWLTCGTTSVLV
jgi:hypothetical protein